MLTNCAHWRLWLSLLAVVFSPHQGFSLLYTAETPCGSVVPGTNVEEERSSSPLLDEDFPCFERQESVFLDSTASICLLKITKMLSLTCRRTLCSHRTLLPLKRMVANRHSSHTAAICSAHHFCNNDISSSRKDLRRSYTNFITSGDQRQGIILTKSVGSFRNYCASPVSQNCWNCKQPLDKTPAFFCMSCNVVQPPEEGTSYFKIMDW